MKTPKWWPFKKKKTHARQFLDAITSQAPFEWYEQTFPRHPEWKFSDAKEFQSPDGRSLLLVPDQPAHTSTQNLSSTSNRITMHIPELNQLSQEIFEANKAKGFWDEERNVGEMLMLVVSELGEAQEAHRKGRMVNVIDLIDARREFEQVSKGTSSEMHYFRDRIKDTFEDEIADAIIRLLDMCGGLEIDIESHIQMKLAYNSRRPYKHGKQY